ncbi:uncharacterized protein SPPG_05238 [Spizellomyces punctatus DAOM BR117]|uniref:DUF726 domain-containing protein n=1 Tax=Spizellomyces punctatus (strain DAOM BR117) TaxID=645134 RepID=A0A0L0HEH3_SPIPD|nr:uncharacterized protein SPPG_05238 [Spizellomyces punctatus DAOM BR117]KNC99865.1 hypothetical protein SPPG_05238 [Spizellomyces punctatus DAOM BR117]|eukprot:XP_016607905.1 hypothetical protein SPPG_05238 [Spizellomyces punctatus DAOM BR117]
MSNALPGPQAQAFYNVCVSCISQMRIELVEALEEGENSSVKRQLTEDEKIAINSFDLWAKGLLEVVWLGIVEKDKKEHPTSMEEILSKFTVRDAQSPLKKLPPTSRASLLRTFLLLILTTVKRYDARTRVLLRRLSDSLHLQFPSDYEESVEQALKHPDQAIKATKEAAAKREETGRISRNWKIGLATLAGGVAIGVTGGLAAPLVGAGLASVLGAVGLSGTAAGMMIGGLASSGMVIGSLFGAYGGHMSGKMVAKRTREVTDFDFKPLKVNSRLHVTIAVTGWLNSADDVGEPWTIVDGSGDVEALQWEVQSLLELGRAMTAMIKSQAIGYVKSEILKRTVLASLMSALWPLSLLQVGKLIDNPWSNAMDLAKKTGAVLADVLIEKVQGERPVTLIGYSLGARTIFYCLVELSRRNAYGIVEHAYMFGLPAPGSRDYWRSIRRVVSGRIVNGYSTNDWLLAFLYRTTNIKYMVPGLSPVKVRGVEDIDVSSIVEGHLKYRGTIGQCLALAAAEDLNGQQIEEQKKVLHEIERQESVEDVPMEELVQVELEKTKADRGDSAHSLQDQSQIGPAQ